MFAKITSIIGLFFLSLSAFAASPNDLIGTFSAVDKGKMIEFAKIEKRENSYILFSKKKGAWQESKKPLELVTPQQFEKLLNGPQPPNSVGLANKGMGIFKVNKGWQQGKFKTDTGYFMFFIFGPVELHKS